MTGFPGSADETCAAIERAGPAKAQIAGPVFARSLGSRIRHGYPVEQRKCRGFDGESAGADQRLSCQCHRPETRKLPAALRTYVTVVEKGSFAAAAASLWISRAMATKHVADLEAHLGTRLLNRTTAVSV